MTANGPRIPAFFKTVSILLSLLLVPTGKAQTPGTFVSTGSMATARYGHTATLLADGRVLIAGGGTDAGRVWTTTAELYDPATGRFTTTGSMNSARISHTATLLQDGRVLIVGGVGPLIGPSAELYDPSTGIFAATGGMVTSKGYSRNTATLLGDGRVLIIGTTSDVTPADAELYDPRTGTFTATGSMVTPPSFATATLLPNGKVLVAASIGASALYDPATGTFSPTGTENQSETGVATLLTNGSVLVAGGDDDDPGSRTSAEVYDASTGTFTITGNMAAPRAQHTATLLSNGQVLVTGGNANFSLGLCCLSSAELYDSSTGLFNSTGSMAAGRSGHTATLLKSGDVLIAGGNSSDTDVLTTAEIYRPAPLPPDPIWQATIDGMKALAGSDSLNFWQWDWLWQRTPAFPGAPPVIRSAGVYR